MTTGILVYIIIYLFVLNMFQNFRYNAATYKDPNAKHVQEICTTIFSLIVVLMFFGAVGAGIGYAIAAFTGMI